MMSRRDRERTGEAEGQKVGVTLAITAMGVLATMAEPAVSPARRRE